MLHLRGKQSKNGKYHSYKGTVGKVADNLLQRDFHADKPFEKLTTDVTEFKIGNEKVYLSPVLDMYNREIISYSISTSPNLQQVRDIFRPRLAIPTCRIPAVTCRTQYYAKHVTKR